MSGLAAATRSGLILLPLAASMASGCAGDTPRPGELRGFGLVQPWPKPDFTLLTTRGERFEFRSDTDGYVTLLFFGYTNCPDVCPVHMANIAAVLPKLPPQVATAIKVVFVTTDPERDTPERLESWLSGFDPRFIGLVGSLEAVNKIQRDVGLAPATRLGDRDDGYRVGHAAQVVAYTRDNQAHVVYPFGTRQADWAHDLPILVEAKRWDP